MPKDRVEYPRRKEGLGWERIFRGERRNTTGSTLRVSFFIQADRQTALYADR